jgi:hypothetical protein
MNTKFAEHRKPCGEKLAIPLNVAAGTYPPRGVHSETRFTSDDLEALLASRRQEEVAGDQMAGDRFE